MPGPRPTAEQIGRALELLAACGYPVNNMGSPFRGLAPMSQRYGTVEGWLRRMNRPEILALIARLKEKLGEQPDPPPKPKRQGHARRGRKKKKPEPATPPVAPPWRIRIVEDALRWTYNEELHSYVYMTQFWVLATSGRAHYMHYYDFADDWDRVAGFVRRIVGDFAGREADAPAGFTPEGKPGVWHPIRDVKPIGPPRRWTLKWWWNDLQRKCEEKPLDKPLPVLHTGVV